MKKYRVKNPIIVEAVQFSFYPSKDEWPDCVHPHRKRGIIPRDMSWGYIETVEGTAHVCAGDWIVKDGAGHLFVCKPDIFEETYEAVIRDEASYE